MSPFRTSQIKIAHSREISSTVDQAQRGSAQSWQRISRTIIPNAAEFNRIEHQTRIDAARGRLQRAEARLATAAKAKPGAQSALLPCQRELKALVDKASTMTKIFAVIDVAHVRALGFAVIQDDRAYRGHAIIRPATQMAAAIYGTAMLQIPSFVREFRNTHGCETLELVSCQDRLSMFAAAFGGIATGCA
jgi:hypothetical protein